jgi:hypothetical protein
MLKIAYFLITQTSFLSLAKYKAATATWDGDPQFKESHEQYAGETYVTLHWTQPTHSGFDFYSYLEYCQRDQDAVEEVTTQLVLHPTFWSQDEFKETIV